MRTNYPVRHSAGERGSALLIVFVFAAFVAIALYKEMPVIVFEAQRRKEQVLIDRASEYERAIKLFYIHNQRYPTSLDQLEDTNSVRYLRRRYKDPLTGKAEWRLIHIGPNFMLLDSKVTPLKLDANGKPIMPGASTASGMANGENAGASAGAGAGGFPPGPSGPAVMYMTPGQPVAYHFYAPGQIGGPARPPAIPAATATANLSNGTTDSGSGNDNGTGGPQNTDPYAATAANAQAASSGQPGAPPDALQAAQTAAQPGIGVGFGFAGGAASTGQAATNPNAQPTGIDVINRGLRQQGPQSPSAFSNNTNFGAGAIAGVASTGEGHSIKLINDQSDYSKWEFTYDPRKDIRTIPIGGGGGTGQPPPPPR